MNTQPATRSGAEALIAGLRDNGIDRIFCIPGESYLAALDALYDCPEIELIVCRNEGGAAYMAEADGKLTGRPGVCFVTRGPGAMNASGGLHVALQDSTPMILLVGQVARRDLDREAFQEIDYRRAFSQVAKWVAQVDDADRIPEYLNRAFSVATGGRPGPVVLALPEDMLADRTTAGDAGPWRPVEISPAAEDVAGVGEILAASERPFVIVGGSGWSDATRVTLENFAAENNLPIANSFRCQDYFDNQHACYAGDLGLGVNPDLVRRIREADCLLVIGARLGEMTTGGFTLLDIPRPRQRLIHVHAGIEELGHVYQPELAINATPARFVAALANCRIDTGAAWRERVEAAHADYLAWNAPLANDGEVQLAEIVHALRRLVPEDALVCNGAGNNTCWLHRFFRYRRYRTQLAPTSGTMGYGLPAAIAARLRHRERTVVAFVGDGDLMMNLQEFATAAQYRLGLVLIVVNNGIYATIRMHQERDYPARVIGTDMVNPDFVALAEAHGAHAERVSRTDQFEAAFGRALDSRRLALIEVRIEPGVLTPTATVASLRARG